MSILDYIPYGRNNAVTRTQLVTATGMDDRAIREQIEKARREEPVLNMQDGKGYFRPIPEEKPLVERWLKQEESRAKSKFCSLKGARDFVRKDS